MKNTYEVTGDIQNAYIVLSIESSSLGRWILATMTLGLIAFLIAILGKLSEYDFDLLIPILALFFVFGIAMKYLLWNRYGQEAITLTPNSISYAYNYGWFQSRLKTKMISGNAMFECMAINEELGKIIFTAYDEVTGLPYTVYESAVLLPIDDAKQLMKNLKTIFAEQYFDNLVFSDKFLKKR